MAERDRESQEMAGRCKELATEVKAANVRAEKAGQIAEPTAQYLSIKKPISAPAKLGRKTRW
tara:strand:+ start:353 stop:538 length:186 start_codon:yes stop_codon:yes gene_type:complete